MINNTLKKTAIAVFLVAMTAQVAMAERLPGEYAIRTLLKNTYLTARPGNHSIDAIITSATAAGPYEKFRFERMQPNYTIMLTPGNYYVSAANGGGRGGSYDAAQTLQTERKLLADDALFRLQTYGSGSLNYTIQTFYSYYLTALGGGGKSTGAFHTDARKASTWEGYRITKCGDVGSGFAYAIYPKGFSRPLTTTGTVKVPLADSDAIFKLIRQPSTGWHELWYVKRSGSTGTVAIMEQGHCTYTLQTTRGSWIGVNQAGNVSNTIPNPKTGTNLGYNVYFELAPVI
jgi:hypothetical protein